MFKIKINNNQEHSVSFSDDAQEKGVVDGHEFELDIVRLKEGSYHVLRNNKSYTIELIKAEPADKTFVISVNGKRFDLKVKDKFDELLQSMGLDTYAGAKVNEVKAPMPGLVLDIKIKEGDVVKKGDALLVLEAMKMENILKSPADGTVKKINVQKGLAVEKGQVLISFA